MIPKFQRLVCAAEESGLRYMSEHGNQKTCHQLLVTVVVCERLGDAYSVEKFVDLCVTAIQS